MIVQSKPLCCTNAPPISAIKACYTRPLDRFHSSKLGIKISFFFSFKAGGVDQTISNNILCTYTSNLPRFSVAAAPPPPCVLSRAGRWRNTQSFKTFSFVKTNTKNQGRGKVTRQAASFQERFGFRNFLRSLFFFF